MTARGLFACLLHERATPGDAQCHSATTCLPSALGATVWCSVAACPLHICWLVSSAGVLCLVRLLAALPGAENVSVGCLALVRHPILVFWSACCCMPLRQLSLALFVGKAGLVCFGHMPAVQALCASRMPAQRKQYTLLLAAATRLPLLQVHALLLLRHADDGLAATDAVCAQVLKQQPTQACAVTAVTALRR